MRSNGCGKEQSRGTLLCTPSLKIRARCGSSARRDLCGGHEVTHVPTATTLSTVTRTVRTVGEPKYTGSGRALPTVGAGSASRVIHDRRDAPSREAPSENIEKSYAPADFAALRAACSLFLSSCESEVIKILPPDPFSSSSTLSLYGVGFLTRTKRVELPGISVALSSFMK